LGSTLYMKSNAFTWRAFAILFSIAVAAATPRDFSSIALAYSIPPSVT